MNIQIKYLVIIVIVSAVVGGSITKKFMKPDEVIKTQIVNNDVVKDHIITVVKEIDKPDGTKDITTVTKDDRTNTDVSTTTSSDTKAPISKNWLVTGGIGLDGRDSYSRMYQISVNRRVLGPIYVGAWANTTSTAGLSVGFEF